MTSTPFNKSSNYQWISHVLGIVPFLHDLIACSCLLSNKIEKQTLRKRTVDGILRFLILLKDGVVRVLESGGDSPPLLRNKVT